MMLQQTSLLGQRVNAFIILINIAKFSSIGAVEFCTPIIKRAKATKLISEKAKLGSMWKFRALLIKDHPAWPPSSLVANAITEHPQKRSPDSCHLPSSCYLLASPVSPLAQEMGVFWTDRQHGWQWWGRGSTCSPEASMWGNTHWFHFPSPPHK